MDSTDIRRNMSGSAHRQQACEGLCQAYAHRILHVQNSAVRLQDGSVMVADITAERFDKDGLVKYSLLEEV